MSEENNDDFDRNRFSKNSRYISLRRRLSVEINKELDEITKGNSTKSVEAINESSLKKIESHLMKHDCAVISFFKDELVDCVSKDIPEEVKCIIENIGMRKSLHAALLYFDYGVAVVKESLNLSYLENNSIEVIKDSFFVVNINNAPDFKETITELGKIFCQNNILIMEKGGGINYLVCISHSGNPEYQNITKLGKFKLNINTDIISLEKERSFFVETFRSIQINSKRIITERGRPIVNMIKNNN